MKPLFLDDMGRRFFTYLIDAELGFEYVISKKKKKKLRVCVELTFFFSTSNSVEISESNFELLVFLFTTCMEHLDLSNGADYIGYVQHQHTVIPSTAFISFASSRVKEVKEMNGESEG